MASIHFVLFQFCAILLICIQFSALNQFSARNDDHQNNRKDINKTVDKQATTEKIHDTPYYKSIIKVDKTLSDKYWSSDKKFLVDDILSQSRRGAVAVELSFDFPFYGNTVRKVVIASGGFLYVGENSNHSWLAVTQYIAPLMMNFDASLSNVTSVKYADNESIEAVHRGHEEKFSLKIGLSDAYVTQRLMFKRLRNAIYEYDRLSFNASDITEDTLIYMKAKPTCLQHTNCETCVSHLTGTFNSFNCTWCPSVKRCSSGVDRKRSEWVDSGCLENSVADPKGCAVTSSNNGV